LPRLDQGVSMAITASRRLIALISLAGAAVSGSALAGKHHVLKAAPDDVAWGWLDPREKPRLTIESGDTVSIETLMHARDQIHKDVPMDQIVALRKANPGGGPHSLTGPIFVTGAAPGDVLEIRILKIVPKKVGTNCNLPGKDFPTIGALPAEFPEGYVKYFDIDARTRTTVFKPGITIPVRPFPGTLAVGIDPDDPAPRKGGVKDDKLAPVSSLRPWKNGSNMDINELTAGSTIFIPVFQPGGLIWTGDSHCAQGNGEVNLTAIECSFEEIELQPIVRKDLKLTWPRIETPTHYIMVGFDESLDKAFSNALAETIDFLVTSKGLTKYEAYSLASIAADCRVSQVVDVRKGIHCMVAKSLFGAKK
ncbi:MAG TPA: acetamidase/formamidase family protein, partial [Kofleriaceae bacterium]|nr:acetamidase/formamidase family protein [Kofleriaceae bacterium]